MSDRLAGRMARELASPVLPAVRAVAEQLAGSGVVAVLFYGSILRTGDLGGVLDFYVLTDARRPPKIWPRVGYREFAVAGQTLRAKIATLPLATFAKAARGGSRDTTIWARFVQPAALVWQRDAATAASVAAAVADAVATAARFAAALGPESGEAVEFWRALFRATYAAEFRVEAGGREDQIVAHDPARYAELLPLGWQRAGLWFDRAGEMLHPHLTGAERRAVLARWRSRRRWGKPLNVVRLLKAAFTFDGAARYAAWKIERHTGVPVPLQPWQERHPILAAPGVLWRVWRAK
ncbi:MAG: hypothetical protein V4659_06050 [Pseudomonadota bacterium]